ncbi:MAG TPA: acyltransferase [Methylophilaceae bacterium]
MTLGKGVRIGRCTIIATGQGISIGDFVGVGDGTLLDAHHGKINIHQHTAIGPYVVVYGEGGVTIGKYSMLAAHAVVVASNHVYDSIDMPIKLQGTTAEGVSIADDVWIGTHAVIQDGVSIGKGSIVGSGAVVRVDIPEYMVAAGVPARIIKNRIV